MKLIKYIKSSSTNSSDLLEKSYREGFVKYAPDEELEALRDHKALYKKVVEELEGNVKGAEEMSSRFSAFVTNDIPKIVNIENIYIDPKTFSTADLNVSLFDSKTWSKPVWTYEGTPPVLSGHPKADLSGILQKLDQGSDVTETISFELKDPENIEKLDPEVLENFLAGIRTTDLTMWGRLEEAVHLLASFLQKLITSSDMSLLLEYCKTNEKFIFIVFFHYFFQPLKKLMWSFLYPVFSLQVESFTFFLKKVSLKIGKVIRHQTAIVNGFCHFKVSKKLRITLGTGGISGLLLLFNKYAFTNNSTLVPLYHGMNGLVGESAKFLRLEGSKVIFEITKTLSTFSNAALAGFLEPKHEAVKQILDAVGKRR